MSQATDPNAAVRTERVLSADPRTVFAAFEQPDKLARWWGPSGFTNTFEHFEFKPGGRWVFVMHGPNSASYPNESVFREIEPHTRIVIEHVVKPWYRLTVTLAERGGETHLAWVQEFESAEMAAKMRRISEPANEQNLDRLQSLLASEGA
ncbi:SRPBCC domain-containing protein [Longimicrobium sp.]|uniref:SRPBCC domain-containing protein n=1 Tax=Longimicrobium sp. TaxID=2029185 RepID=UPI003B3AD37F